MIATARRRVLATSFGRFAVKAVSAVLAVTILWNWTVSAYHGFTPWSPVFGFYLLAVASWVHGWTKGRLR